MKKKQPFSPKRNARERVNKLMQEILGMRMSLEHMANEGAAGMRDRANNLENNEGLVPEALKELSEFRVAEFRKYASLLLGISREHKDEFVKVEAAADAEAVKFFDWLETPAAKWGPEFPPKLEEIETKLEDYIVQLYPLTNAITARFTATAECFATRMNAVERLIKIGIEQIQVGTVDKVLDDNFVFTTTAGKAKSIKDFIDVIERELNYATILFPEPVVEEVKDIPEGIHIPTSAQEEVVVDEQQAGIVIPAGDQEQPSVRGVTTVSTPSDEAPYNPDDEPVGVAE